MDGDEEKLPLPPAGPFPRGMVPAVLVGMLAAWVCSVAAWVAGLSEDVIGWTFFAGWSCFPFVAVGLGEWVRVAWRRWQRRVTLRRAAQMLGMRFTPWLPAEKVVPLAALPLLRCLSRMPRCEMRNHLCGTFDGWRVEVWDLGVAGRVGLAFGSGGFFARVFTVVLLRGVEDLPALHLSPREAVWNEVVPAPALEATLGKVVALEGELGSEYVLRGEEVRDLLTVEVREGLAGGLWTVESGGGMLLVLRDDVPVPAGQVPMLLGKAVDLAEGLSAAARAQAGGGRDRA